MISVVIPAFNEEGAIKGIIKSLVDVLNNAGYEGYEVLVIDDGSLDRTAEIARDAGAQVIQKPQNIGYGHSLKVGIKSARNDIIVIIDGDGTYPVTAIPELLEYYAQGFDMIIGERTGKYYRESVIKFPLRLLFKVLVEYTVGTNVPDVNSGLRVFSREEILKLFPYLSDGFSFTTSSTLAYALQKKYMRYVPIEYYKRVGESKVRLFRDSLRALQSIVQAIVYYNPIKMFLVLSTFVLCVGILLLATALWLGSLVLAGLGGGAGLTAVIIFALGLLAENMRLPNCKGPSGD